MNKEELAPIIKRFKKIVSITFFLGLIGISLGAIIRSASFDINSCLLCAIVGRGLVLLIIVGYILSLVYLYKTAKGLKLSGKLNIKPSLILLLTLLSTPLLFVIPIIIFIIIWQKADNYLKSN